MTLALSCTFIGVCLFILGSSGNSLCILVFLRKKFRHRIITPYFIALLLADSIYLLFRLIKLFYYSQTLFKGDLYKQKPCSHTLLVRIYHHATQTWPQIFVPLVQSETIMRFSLILMSIMSAQRTMFINHSFKRLTLPAAFTDVNKHKWTFLIIIIAFLIAYTFEFAGLIIFCSKSNNRDISYDWFLHMAQKMENSSYLLTNTMTNKSDDYHCVQTVFKQIQQSNVTYTLTSDITNDVCTKEILMNILADYFDKHEKPIVNLIQKILLNQTGQKMARNEIRLKYHFHKCLFPQEPKFFDRHYNFMYSRLFGLNRRTLLLVFGSVVPSIITIASNILSVSRVRKLNALTSIHIKPSRRRTDDTRRVLLVITVECLLAIVGSWITDILLSVIFCKRNLLAGDDCPMYLKQNTGLLVMFDFFNSISNIVVHCLCSKRFRNELKRMLKSWCTSLEYFTTNYWCCYCQIRQPTQQNYDQSSVQTRKSGTRDTSNSSNSPSQQQVAYIYIKMSPVKRPNRRHCCDCRCYFNRKPILAFHQCLSAISKQWSQQHRTTSYNVQYNSLPQRTVISRPNSSNSMRLYFPPSLSPIPERKNWTLRCI